MLSHEDIFQLNQYFNDSEISPQIFNRLKIISQQIKNYNKKIISQAMAFVPQPVNFQGSSYSIPKTGPRAFQFGNTHNSGYTPEAAPPSHFPDARNDQYGQPSRSPPKVPPQQPRYEFNGAQQTYDQQPPGFEMDQGQFDGGQSSANFPEPGEEKSPENTFVRTMPQISFQQIEGHMYRSQKKAKPQSEGVYPKESARDSETGGGSSFDAHPKPPIDFKANPRSTPPPPHEPKRKMMSPPKRSYNPNSKSYLDKRNNVDFESESKPLPPKKKANGSTKLEENSETDLSMKSG